MAGARRLGSQVVFALLCAWGLGPGTARGQAIELVAQLDPYPGANRYADVWGEGDYAYIGSFQGSGVGIIDISDPETPVLVTTYGSGGGGQFKDIKVHGGIGYFASDNGGGVHIVDLADPTTPVLLAQITSLDGGYDDVHNVFYGNGYLYQADTATPTVKVFDVIDPASPFFVRDIVTPDPDRIHDVTVVDDRLYASGLGGFTHVYDVSAVGASPPALLGSVASGSRSHASWVSSDGAVLISAREISGGDVRIFDISDPANAVLLSIVDAASLGIDAFSPHNPVLVNDSLLFVSWYQAGVVALDIGDPESPVLVGNFDTFPGAVSGFKGNWGVYPQLGLDRVLLSDLDGGLFIVDATAVAPSVPALGGPLAWLLLGPAAALATARLIHAGRRTLRA